LPPIDHPTSTGSPVALDKFRVKTRHFLLLLVSTVGLLSAGCGAPVISDAQPKRADDRITPSELKRFLAVVASLPDGQLPKFPPVLLPPPHWSGTRTLPVSELVKDEETQLIEHRTIDWLVAHCPESRFLKRALRRERMTLEQFIGLYVALGYSLSRSALPEDRELNSILKFGKQVVAVLRRDRRVFSTLTGDEAFVAQEEAGWITLTDRASQLTLVHPENLLLVLENHAELAKLFPPVFSRNQLEEFQSILDDRGIPFDEPSTAESDAHIPWSRSDAIVGSDKPVARRP
jgi:hypothetical protein